jgi:hypothetical protein
MRFRTAKFPKYNSGNGTNSGCSLSGHLINISSTVTLQDAACGRRMDMSHMTGRSEYTETYRPVAK